MRLGRILCRLVPDHAEAHGLLALMELQASRARARTTASGEPVLLLDQDRARWDQLLIRRGFVALNRAATLFREGFSNPPPTGQSPAGPPSEFEHSVLAASAGPRGSTTVHE